MKQVQFVYENPDQLGEMLQSIGELRGNKPMKLLFRIFSEQTDFEQLNVVCSTIVDVFPDAICVGSSSNGNICDGQFSGETIAVSCSVFERESTQVEILQYVLNEESAKPVAQDLVCEIAKRPWVSAVGLLAASAGISFTGFCNELSAIPQGIKVFGGLAGQSAENEPAYVFSNMCGFSNESVVCVLYGGEDLHVETVKIGGWKPLGKPFMVTKAEGNVLWELDNRPAFEAYRKYLNIENDYFFFSNTLEFPLFYYENGETLLRSPMACSEDGALLLASDMKNGSSTRIAYGDPQSILESVGVATAKFGKFVPEAIFMFAGVARRTFWGEEEVSKETQPLNEIAPTSGYYVAGEFLRAGKFVCLHNATAVVAAMREGEADFYRQQAPVVNDKARGGRVSVITRLANFTNVSSAELVEMYTKLAKTSVTDSLTGLYNRGEIQRRITERFTEYPNDRMSLVMIDIDNFKSVNDTFGHKEGDNVITGLSNQIQMTTFENAPDADAGRWGGEEFMIMLPDMGIQEAVGFAEAVRTGFAQIQFSAVGKKTISLGATELKEGDTIDSICVRVDEALYEAKRTGKNKVVVL